ncbi:unnamed protein product, partial [Ectocarpus sp. 4 AP-2014]
MNADSKGCCRRPASRTARLAVAMSWVGPLAMLALVPKCPACLAAYLMLATGLGLSAALASAFWGTLIGLSITCLLLAVGRFLWR